MTRAFRALTAEPWAIDPSWLPFLAAIALRSPAAAGPQATWAGLDLATFAGPSGRRLEGARYAVTNADGVAMIPMFGPIFPRANMMLEVSGATTCQALAADYDLCLSQPDIGAVLWLIDSPGGHTSGIAALADKIRIGSRQKLTAAHVLGSGASAAYWLGSQAKQFTADRTAILGSIGVCCGLTKQVEPDANGEMAFDIVSSNAPDKVPDPATDEGRAAIVAMLDALEAQFIGDVALARSTTPTKVKAEFGKGGVLVGQAAAAAGMIDQVSTFEAVYRGLAQHVSSQRKLKALKG